MLRITFFAAVIIGCSLIIIGGIQHTYAEFDAAMGTCQAAGGSNAECYAHLVNGGN